MSQPAAKRPRLDAETVPQLSGSQYHNNNAQGDSRNIYGNVINNYNSGLHQAPAGLRSAEEAQSPFLGDIKSILKNLEFEQMNDRLATIATAHLNTCEWLFRKREYKAWRDLTALNTDRGFLWIKGKPGAGKSILMKSAQHHGEQRYADLIASFYFNARGAELEKSTQGMYRSLLHQLLEKRMEQCAALFEREGHLHHLKILERLLGGSLNKRNRSASQHWPIELLKDALRDLILAFSPAQISDCANGMEVPIDAETMEIYRNSVLALSQKPITFYVDALDECEDDGARDMIDFLETLRETAANADVGIRVLLTSRHYPHITLNECQELILDSQDGHEADIAQYIRSKLRLGESRMARDLQATIQTRASGVFLWVRLVIQILNKSYDHGQIRQLEARLLAIPVGLHELFGEILQKNVEDREELILVFQLLLFSHRPLRPREFYRIVTRAFDFEDGIGNRQQNNVRADDFSRFILGSSKGLAELTKSYPPTVQFIHESVRDYLLETGLAALEPSLSVNLVQKCHAKLNKCCLQHLEDFRIYVPPSESEDDRMDDSGDAYMDDAEDHYEIEGGDSSWNNPSAHSDNPSADSSVDSWDTDNTRDDLDDYFDDDFAEYFDHKPEDELGDASEREPDDGSEPEQKSGTVKYSRRFLRYVLKGVLYHADLAHSPRLPWEDFATVFPQYLWRELYNLAKPEFPLSAEVSTLYMFILMGASTLAEAYIEAEGLPSQSPGHVLTERHRSLLGPAVDKCDHGMVTMLLRHGIGANWPAIGHHTCLTLAVRRRDAQTLEALIKALLEAAADPNIPNDLGDFPIHGAVRWGCEEILRTLLESGADPPAADGGQARPLHQTAIYSNNSAIQLPVVHRANVNARNRQQETPLHVAAILGRQTSARLLLDHGADVHASDDQGKSAIIGASTHGYLEVVDMLLEAGDPVPIEQLSYAAYRAFYPDWGESRAAIVERLVQKGAKRPGPQ
jgi:ankyrin repeat protein